MGEVCAHAASVEETLRAWGTTDQGLSEREAALRLARDGPNRISAPVRKAAWTVLLAQFRSVVVLLLVGAMALSWALGDLAEATAIALVVGLNALIGFGLELRAHRAMEALRQLGSARATVVRDGRLTRIDAGALVAGDIVDLRAGARIPADGRVIAATELRTSEASLTGESLPVSKRADLTVDRETPLAERANMVYHGTIVVSGVARVVTTATGDRTEVGRIGVLTQSVADDRTPLERRLDELGRRLVWVSLAVAAAVAGVGLAQGEPWPLMVETAIALAVAAVPEALPTVATITLAIGLHRMARRRALVRRLPVVEALGSTTVVCTDKTRTLTSGDMTVAQVWTPAGTYHLTGSRVSADLRAPALQFVADAAARASVPPSGTTPDDVAAGADPVDHAMRMLARRVGRDPGATTPPVAVIPFSSERQFMAAFSDDGGRLIVAVKGAPQRIVEMCRHMVRDGREEPLDAAARDALLVSNRALAADGLRVIGVATGEPADVTEAALTGLTFAGFVGLMDPPAEGVREAIAKLRAAGLRTVMLTGDQRATAEAIGRDLGVLDAGAVGIDSRELAAIGADELRARVPHLGVFSRVAPEDKMTIVQALQARGEVVAMIGDGVNDAPALRRADVGVAMGGRGTDVAKEAAAVVLQDDRFETIVAAVEEGRVIFDNIRKFVFYLFSCNLAEILVLLGASLAGLPLPLLPLQILWLNLVTDTFPALALAVEPGARGLMQRPPRDPREALLSRPFLAGIAGYGVLIAATVTAAYVWALGQGSPRATTVAFMALALAQTFHLGTARSEGPVLRPAAAVANPFALAAVALSVALQLVAVYVPPIARTLHVAPLSAPEWLVVTVAAAVPAVIGQLLRLRASGRRTDGSEDR